MTSAIADRDGTMGGVARLEESVETALRILKEEREAFLTGAYHLLADLSARKLDIVGRIESDVREAPRSDTIVDMIRRVISAARRNEEIIAAARHGLAFARRRIDQLREMERGAVAYAEDGTRIASRADMLGDTTSF
jgi:hypothetical protein